MVDIDVFTALKFVECCTIKILSLKIETGEVMSIKEGEVTETIKKIPDKGITQRMLHINTTSQTKHIMSWQW